MLKYQMKKLIKFHKDALRILSKEFDKSEEGRLIPNPRRNGYKYFYERRGGKRIGIKRRMDRVYKLAKHEYLAARLEELTSICSILEIAESSLNNLAKQNLSAGVVEDYRRSDLNIMLFARSKWQISNAGKQSQNPYRREELIYESRGGIKTRSKTERDICTALEKRGTSFGYEIELEIDVTDLGHIKGSYYRNGRIYKKIYPDFTIFLADGSILILEHLGRMDLETYRQKNGEKILMMLHSGIIDQDHLLVTFEHDFRDVKALDHFIDTRIVPYI